MRTRMVREGSVGLLILLGLGLVTGLFLWLRGFTFGRQSYKTIIEFANAGGMQKGAVVRYRGVKVGKITAIQPKTNGVEVEVEISPATLIIPKDVAISANQSGLVGEVTIDMEPQSQLPPGEIAAKPTDKNCDRQLIVCDGTRLHGEIGVSLDQLILNVTRLTSIYSSPELFESIKQTAKNASVATASVADLSRDLRQLTKSAQPLIKTAQQQIGSLSVTANSVQRTANLIGTSTSRTATKFTLAADQIRLTAAEAGRLVTDIDTVLNTNRSSLVVTLNNLSQTSQQLRQAVNGLAPTVNRITRGKLIDNLETLTANAAQASANLRDASSALNNPTNLLLLQKTLDSARVTFENAQKITSDLDDLTGDPKLRENLKRLINGLSGLVTSTQQVQQEVQVAQTLESTVATLKSSKVDAKLPQKSTTSTSLADTLTEWEKKQKR